MYMDKDINLLLTFLRKKAKENNAPIWRYIAELINRPKRRRVAVNISKINRYTKNGDWVVVPGKLLGAGQLNHKVNIAALKYSEKAYRKLRESGSTIMSIRELVEKNPKGSGVKIIV